MRRTPAQVTSPRVKCERDPTLLVVTARASVMNGNRSAYRGGAFAIWDRRRAARPLSFCQPKGLGAILCLGSKNTNKIQQKKI